MGSPTLEEGGGLCRGSASPAFTEASSRQGHYSLFLHLLCPVWVPRGPHFLLAFQLHTRPQLAVANCSQQVRNVGSPKRD